MTKTTTLGTSTQFQLYKGPLRGKTRTDWLESYHSFSFGDYYDPNNIGFSHLRVINEDWVQPGQGFGMHGHSDMEIITVVLSGLLTHRDSLGNGSTISPGEVQRMTAGTGIRHSEFNHSQTEPVHLLQIWILPEQKGLTPGYEQKAIIDSNKVNQWQLLASHQADANVVHVHQDMALHTAFLENQSTLTFESKPGRALWLQLAEGTIGVNGVTLEAGDAVSLESPGTLTITGQAEKSQLLLFDLLKL